MDTAGGVAGRENTAGEPVLAAEKSVDGAVGGQIAYPSSEGGEAGHALLTNRMTPARRLLQSFPLKFRALLVQRWEGMHFWSSPQIQHLHPAEEEPLETRKEIRVSVVIFRYVW